MGRNISTTASILFNNAHLSITLIISILPFVLSAASPALPKDTTNDKYNHLATFWSVYKYQPELVGIGYASSLNL